MNLRKLLYFLPILFLVAVTAKEPVPLIFDTDMGNDIDDAMALAVIHSLEARGACKLLAVTSTKDHPKSAAFIDALNTFYGKPDIPIGAVRNGVTPELAHYNHLADEKDRNFNLCPNPRAGNAARFIQRSCAIRLIRGARAPH